MFTHLKILVNRAVHRLCAPLSYTFVRGIGAELKQEVIDEPVRPTYLYIELENIMAQIEPFQSKDVARSQFDQLLLTMARGYSGPVYVYCYGNLSAYGLKGNVWNVGEYYVHYIDMPEVNSYGKTLTVPEMVATMLDNSSQAARSVLVSNNELFIPLANRLHKKDHPLDVIHFGSANIRLLTFVSQCLDGRPMLG